ncbi:MAG: CDP-alcohol phosphatidyltransferase family protein [Elusimicrobia bacterium]|nr:CDP-alcohol phosphatidyltransferase family protein [Elusimicrobiota bacterium]MBU2614008.1 CDP-alcohol phosphatidyltransferase family protein [Elusimicrobiota bacterium]
MNIANLITLIRILLVPVFIYYLKLGNNNSIPLIIFSICVLTDLLDGFLARTLKMQTQIGSTLDPIADKVLIISSYYIFCALGKIPMWLFLLVIGKDIIIVSGLIFIFTITHKYRISVQFIGKLNTTMQVLTIFLVLLGLPNLQILFFATGLTTLLTTLDYYLKGSKLLAS